MTLHETLRLGYQALGVNVMRSMLTALGIVVGVAAVVCMVSVGMGAEADIAEKIRTLGANLLVVKPGAQAVGGVRRAAGTRQTLTEEDTVAISREVADVRIAASLVSRSLQLVAGNRNWATLVAGVTANYLVAREWRIDQGRPLIPGDVEADAKVAVIGSVVRDELFAEHAAVGAMLRIGAVPFTVVGVLQQKGEGAAGRSQDDVVFIPLSTAKSRILGAVHGDRRDGLDMILVKVTEARAFGDIKDEIRALLRTRHHLRADAADDFIIDNPADVLVARQEAARTLGYLLFAVASVALVVGGISIMNIMLVSVTERTREIGLRIAVGARRRDIRLQFLAESTILAAAGGLLGALVGCVAAAIIAWRAGWPILISPAAIVLAWCFAGLVGTSFGLYPAECAARLDPLAALRFE